jgi:hypothetical protein
MSILNTSSIQLNNSVDNSGELPLCLLEIYNAAKTEKFVELVIEGSAFGTSIPFPNLFTLVQNQSYVFILTNITPFDAIYKVSLNRADNLILSGAVVGTITTEEDGSEADEEFYRITLSEGDTVQFSFLHLLASNINLALTFADAEVEGAFTKNAIEAENGNIVFPGNGFNSGEIPNKQFFTTTTNWLYPNPWYVKKKVCSVRVENVENCFDGGGQSAGIGQYINFINSNDVLSTPKNYDITATLSNENFVTAGGRFYYETGKKFSRLQTLADSRMHDLTSEGTIGQLSPRSQLVFRLPNSRAALGALKKMANIPGIIVFTNGSDHKIILGTKIFPAKISGFATKQSETESYIEITITSGTKYPMYWSGTL